MSRIDPPVKGDINQDNGWRLITVSCVFSVLTITVVGARFYATRLKKALLGADDWMCIPALIAGLALNINSLLYVKLADAGKHVETVKDPEKLVTWGKLLYSQVILYALAIVLPEIAILLFYLRIFPSLRFKIAIYALGCVVVGWGIAVIFTSIFQCKPISYAWTYKPPGKCIKQPIFYKWISLPNIAFHIVVLVLPVHMVWKLQLPRKQRWALSGVFFLGGIGCIASAVRMSIFFRKNVYEDPTWTTIDLSIWSVIECAVILIAACLPTLRPLFYSILKGPSRSTGSKSKSTKSQTPSGMDTFMVWKGTTKPCIENKGFARIVGTPSSSNEFSDIEADPVPLRPLTTKPRIWAEMKGLR